MRPQLARSVFTALLGASLVVFLLPADDVSGTNLNDKVVHAGTFLVLAVAGRWAGARPLPLGLGLAAYAVVTEVLQAVLPIGRHGDPRDFAADVVGVLLGLTLARAAELWGASRARRSAP